MSPQHLYFRRRHFWWRKLLSVTIAHMKWCQSLFVTINHYWWWTLNVTTTPILSATPPLVTFSFWWWGLLSITIAHMKWGWSLSIIINNYWWWTLNVTTTPILSATPPLVTFSFGDEGSFDPHQWAYGDIFHPSPMSFFLVVMETQRLF